MRLIALILGFLFGSQTAWAFECAGVNLASSIVICSDPELMRLADERQTAINEARGRIGEDAWPDLWDDQKAWVRSYATACGAPPDRPPPTPVTAPMTACFKRAALARNAFIRSYGILAGAAPPADYAPVYEWILLDAETGQVLSEQNADVLTYPASLTQMMTLYLTFEALDQGRIRLDQALYVSAEAAGRAPSKLALTPGDSVPVRDLILGIVTKSANDAAAVLAEALAGSEAKFAEYMTLKARQLGLQHTLYRNASGLPDAAQRTTARDIARLALALYHQFPREYRYFSTRKFDFRGEVVHSHNHLLEWYQGADGIKTGFVNASGFNLAASAVRDGRRLIGVIMGGRSARSSDTQMASLLDQGFVVLASGRPAQSQNAPVVAAASPPEPSKPVETAPLTPVAPVPPPKSRHAGIGTAFAINAAGEFLTNYHVVKGCTALRVRISGEWQEGRTIASDERNDLAVVRVRTAATVPALRFREGKGIRPADPVVVIGFPYAGLLTKSAQVTTGAVSALSGVQDDTRYLQLTAPVQPGNSGGPLLDLSGNVVGIVSARLNKLTVAEATGTLPENINFAIKSGRAREFLEANRIEYGTAQSTTKLDPACAFR